MDKVLRLTYVSSEEECYFYFTDGGGWLLDVKAAFV